MKLQIIYKKMYIFFSFYNLIKGLLIKRSTPTSEVFLRPCGRFTYAKLGKEPTCSKNYYFMFHNADNFKNTYV